MTHIFDMDELGRRLEASLAGRYQIEAELGRGGMAVVFRGRDLRHERDVAIKVLPPRLSSAIGHERFLYEIKLAAGLSHPYIVPILDSGEADGLLYYVMPVVDGESLRARLRRDGPLPIAEALRIGSEVAEALAHAHAAGIVHRDVKPANILLTGEHALLADFGVARAPLGEGGERLTGTGVVIGTPTYMSPQQALSDGLDDSADQYSLACVLFEMLVGAPPFGGSSAEEILLNHATRPVPSIREHRSDVPAGAAAAIERGLSKSPSERFPSMETFRSALGGVRTRSGNEASSWRRAGGVLVVGLAAAILAWGLSSALIDRAADGTAARSASADRLAVLPCKVVQGADQPGDTILGRTTALQMYLALDGIKGLRVVPFDRVKELAYPGMAELPSVADRLDAASLVRCNLTPGPADSVELIYDVWTGGSAASHRLRLKRDTPGVVDAERFAVAVATLLTPLTVSGDQAFTPTDDVLALRSFLLGYDAFVGERFFEAETLFAAAVRQDSSFALARWRLADVRRWLLEPGTESQPLRELYDQHRNRLGRRNALYLSAASLPPGPSFPRFRVVLDSLPNDAYAHLLYGDELVHRGALFGLDLDEAESTLRRATELNPRFAPAWDHLALVLIRSDEQAAADSALKGLEAAASPSPRDYPMPELLRHAWRERFRPAEAAPGRQMLTSDTLRLPTYARVGVRYFDLPDLQLVLGRALADLGPPGSEVRHSGLNAMAVAHGSLGQPGRAVEALRRAAAEAPPEAAAAVGLAALLWAFMPDALALEGFAVDPAGASTGLAAMADDPSAPPLLRARAAWALGRHAAADSGPASRTAFDRWRSLVEELTRVHGLDDRLMLHLAAVEAAGDGRWRDALETSAGLVRYDSLGMVRRPFGRAAYHLDRGTWYAALAREARDPRLADSARAEWLWHLNSDLEGVPGREIQAGEIDAALGTHARLRTARLAEAFAGDDAPRSWRAVSCREAQRIERRWRDGEPSVQPAVREARGIARRTCRED